MKLTAPKHNGKLGKKSRMTIRCIASGRVFTFKTKKQAAAFIAKQLPEVNTEPTVKPTVEPTTDNTPTT